MLKWALGVMLTTAAMAFFAVDRLNSLPAEPAAAAKTAAPSGAPPAGTNRYSCEEVKQEPLNLRVDGSGHAWGTLETAKGRIRVVVDTGASMTTLSTEDARALGLAPNDPTRKLARFQTANGVVAAQLDRLTNVKLGHLCVYVLDVAILPPGALKGSLLGMNFMRKMRKVEYGQGRIALYQ